MNGKVILVASTFYLSVNELRFRLAVKSVEKAQEHGYPILIIDGSPDLKVSEMLKSKGAIVIRQMTQGMGPSRRELFFHAIEYCREKEIKVIQYLEPEKHDFIRFIKQTVGPIVEGSAHIVMSRRTLWSRKTYPKFQQSTEIKMLAGYAKAMHREEMNSFLGPIAFSVNTAGRYIVLQDPKSYGIEDTYVQMYAPILALKDGVRVVPSKEVDFQYPEDQRREEENALNEKMMEKRTWQMNTLLDAFKKLS